jgi:hypothetical protein
MSCRRAFDVDLAAFVHDARGPVWADFREHYLLCRDCSLEVRTWTELEIILQGGAPPATAHPAPEDLLAWAGEAAPLDPDYGRIVDYHVASCLPCADEIATLRAFDFAGLEADGATAAIVAEAVGAANGRSVVADATRAAAEPAFADAVVVAVDPLMCGPGDAPAAPDREHGGAGGGPPVSEVAVATPAAGFAGPGAAVFPEDASEPVAAPAAAAVAAVDPLVRPRRGVRVLLHPVLGAALVLVLALGALWLGPLQRLPLGRLAGAAVQQVRVAVATVGEPTSAFDPEAEVVRVLRVEAPRTDPGSSAPALAGEDRTRASTEVGPAVATSVPDTGEPATGTNTSEDLWALARLDEARPLEIVAAQLDAGLELEVPVPLTVRAGAVLQVDVRGTATREIVERLPFPGAREVAVRVPSAWLVPGSYEITLGVVRAGPAPVRVAAYTLVVY